MANFFDEMMRNFELQRDKSKSYVCAAHPRTMGAEHPISLTSREDVPFLMNVAECLEVFLKTLTEGRQ